MPSSQQSAKLEVRYLDPKRISFTKSEAGLVRMTLDEECSYLHVLFYRCFPLGSKDNLISVRNGLDDGDTEIGLISDLSELSQEDRDTVEERLHARYFVPVIQSIEKIEEFYGRYVFHVQTDKGFREVAIRNVHEYVRFIGKTRLLIIDSEGCRFDIPDFTKLDAASQQILSKHVIF